MFFRAFYAVRPLSSPAGLPTNALYGYIQMLFRLFKDHAPQHLALAYDNKEPSFRFEIYDQYKANRSEMPPDLALQMPDLLGIGEKLGLKAFQTIGYEADDLIGSLARFCADQGHRVVIVSGDKDFAQLVTNQVVIFDPMKDVTLDPPAVLAKWGVRPDQFIDYLSLVGDTSDNIPGAKGIGPKGAVKLLVDFESLEGIYSNLDKIPAGVRSKLEDSRAQVFLAKELVTIKTDIPLIEDVDDLKRSSPDEIYLKNRLSELGFQKMHSIIEAAKVGLDARDKENTVGSLANGFSFSSPGSTLPAAVVSSGNPADHFERLGWEEFKERFAHGQNRHLWCVFHQERLTLAGEDFLCTIESLLNDNLEQVSAWLDSERPLFMGFDLKTEFHRLKLTNPKSSWDFQIAQFLLDNRDVKTFADWLEMQQPEISGESSVLSVLQAKKSSMEKELVAGSLFHFYQAYEVPLVDVLYKMERTGVFLNTQPLLELSQELDLEVKDLEAKIQKESGVEFNVASPKQLAGVLFETLGLPKGKKTKTGYSTDNDTLAKIKDLHPVVSLVMEYRELSKLKSTYVDSLPELIDPKTQRLHTHYRQNGAQTGRLSSVKPNLQNIPIRTPKGMRVRAAFEGQGDFELLSMDYSQIELRILAEISRDANLIRSFQKGLDIHAATAAEVFEVEIGAVTPEQRRQAKAINFGISYGQGAYGLSESLGITRTEAKGIIQRYFERFPGVKSYMDSTIENAHRDGYVLTHFGRKRYIFELKSPLPSVKQFGERAAINAPIQGTASDLVKMAMVQIASLIRDWPKCTLLLQVHDELIFEGPRSDLETLSPVVKSAMEGVVSWSVPLLVNSGIGKNWSQIH